MPRASLSANHQALIKAENAGRTGLYMLNAAENKTTLDEVTRGNDLARLEHVHKGTWVERSNKSTSRWEGFPWDP